MRKAMLLLAVFGFVVTIWAADPTMGTWKLNIAKSKIPASDAANLKETKTVFREIDANTVEGVSTDTLKDGKTTTTKWMLPNMRKRIFPDTGRNQEHPPLRSAFGPRRRITS